MSAEEGTRPHRTFVAKSRDLMMQRNMDFNGAACMIDDFLIADLAAFDGTHFEPDRS
jgi:hypothetical protein